MNASDWIDVGVGRALDRQRAESDSLKLLVTFVLAAATAMVGTSYQVRWSSGGIQLLDKLSMIAASLALLGVILVFILDSVDEVDVPEVLAQSKVAGETQAQLLARLRLAAITRRNDNEDVLLWMRRAVLAQGSLAAVSFGLAVVSLLRGA